MDFVKVFYAGMWVMRKMRFRTKLGLVLATLLIPLLFAVWQLMGGQSTTITVTRAELQGVALLQDTAGLVRQLQLHRGLTNLVLSGATDAVPKQQKTREAMADALRTLEGRVAEFKDFQMPKEWAQLKARAVSLSKDVEGKSAADSFSLHTSLIEDLGHLVYGIADVSSLLYDPDPLTYLYMDMAVSRVIPWTEQLGRMRGMGAALLGQENIKVEDSARMLMMAASLQKHLRDVRYNFALIEKLGGENTTVLQALTASDGFVALTRKNFADGAGSQDGQAYFEAGTQTIAAVSTFQASVGQSMTDLLQARLSATTRQFWLVAVGSTLAVFAVFYLMLSFNISFLADLRQVLMFMEQTAGGNLRHQARMRGLDELSDMSRSMEVMVNNMSVMVAAVRSNAALVSSAGDSLVLGNQNLSDRTEQQASNLEQTSASVQELSVTVNDNARVASESDVAAQKVRAVAELGAQGMVQAIASIEAIEANTRRMDEIVSVIDGLAFQTNILALNAAVEAARAGDSGRGFAVVAAEVRSLAQRSAASAKEIRTLIGTSTAQVAIGVEKIRAAGDNINHIVEGVRSVAGNMSLISASSAEQSLSLAEITTAIQQLDSITQNNATMVEEAVSQATDLQGRALLLAGAAEAFKLQQGTADEARCLVERALELRRSAASKDAFVRDITAPSSELFDRDMYVFALDRDGRYLAFGGNKSKVGTRVQDVPGINGDALIESIIRQASVAPGWVEYDIVNPTSGKVQTKISYVVQVDDMFVGCGVYKNLAIAV